MTPKNQPLGPLMVDLESTQLQAYELKKLAHPGVGAVILFARNFESAEQITDLVTEIKSVRSPALLIAVDQEGGRVQRFQTGFTRLPAMASFEHGLTESPEATRALIQKSGQLMAQELIHCGIDFSFAPVLDLAAVPSAVIGDRAFSADPQTVCTLADNWITGMAQAGMAATGKHFPGHGHVSADSHLEMPVDERSFAAIQNADLIPFAQLAPRLKAVMTAHVLYPNIDAKVPTYSPYWLQTVLRQSLAFEGIIFSDDLTMKGANSIEHVEDKITACRQAGCDVAIICNEPDTTERALFYCQTPENSDLTQRLIALAAKNNSTKLANAPLEALQQQLAELIS